MSKADTPDAEFNELSVQFPSKLKFTTDGVMVAILFSI
jgi:hypothetical protein